MSFDSDVQGLRGRLNELDDQAKKIREKLEGGQMATLFDMEVYVKGNYLENMLGNYIVKIDGPSNKVQVGMSHNVTVGNKSEGILGISTSTVAVTEYKKVNGWSTARITGLKKETVVGAKWDEIHGTKFEKKAAKTITLGSAAECRKQGSRFEKFGKRIMQILGVKKTAREAFERVRDFQIKVGKLEETISKWEATLKSAEITMSVLNATHQKCVNKVEKAMALDCEGTATMKFDHILAKGHKGASECMVPKARIAKGGSWVFVADGHVTVKGKQYYFK